jgi:acetyl-CoA acetyltransferase
MNDVVITAALCNTVGKFHDPIAKVPAADLGAEIINALLARSDVQAD